MFIFHKEKICHRYVLATKLNWNIFVLVKDHMQCHIFIQIIEMLVLKTFSKKYVSPMHLLRVTAFFLSTCRTIKMTKYILSRLINFPSIQWDFKTEPYEVTLSQLENPAKKLEKGVTCFGNLFSIYLTTKNMALRTLKITIINVMNPLLKAYFLIFKL